MRHFSSGPRLAFVAVCVFGAFAAVAARLVHLHVWMHATAVEEVSEVRRQVEVVRARRGDIVDANGTPLATSRSVVRVGVDPVVLKRDAEAIRKLREQTPSGGRQPPASFEERWASLAALTSMSPAEMQARIDSRRRAADSSARLALLTAETDGVEESGPREVRYVKLADAVEDSSFNQIRQLGLKGVVGSRDYRRFYPGESLAAHVVGYVNHAGEATMGVERLMDFYLRGQDGWRESERDGRRREVARFRSRDIPAVDGMQVQLSLDLVVQHLIETEIARILEEFKPLSATIIVSDPTTGFLLGLANGPTFNLNEFFQAPLDHQRNRAITDVLEPGSTFKIVAIGGALDRGQVTTETRFDCSLTTIEVNGRSLRLPKEAHRFQEPLTVAEIVAKSSNIGSAQLGIRLGAQQLYSYAKAFGFGTTTGFPLTGEVPGILFPPSRWDGLTITRLPMGHAVAATPLQIHMAMATVANGGLLMRPQVVTRVTTAEGTAFATFDPVIRGRALSATTARTLSQLLVKVATKDGTAREAEIPGYEIAGKTGTTQKIIDGRYSNQHHVATFSGFFPASAPRIALTIVIDQAEVSGTAYASRVAVPSFRRLSEQLIQYLGIAPVSQGPHFAAVP